MFPALFLIIILVRLLTLFLPSFRTDMGTWQHWSHRLVEVGPVNFYNQNYFSDYLPGYLYFLWFLGLIFEKFGLASTIFSNQFAILLKFTTNLFDVVTALFIYQIVRVKNEKWARGAFLLYISNPALIFNSSVWGQVDGVPMAFLLGSLYALIAKRPYVWAFALSLAGTIKPQTLIILPIILIYLLKSFSWRKNVISLLILIITPFIIALPFFYNDPLFGIIKLLQRAANVYPYGSIFAYNFWSFFGWWKSDNWEFFGIPYRIIGLFFDLSIITTLSWPLIKLRRLIRIEEFIICCSLLSLGFFLFTTRMHERYLFAFFGLFIITATLYRAKILLGLYFLMSLIHLANLWYVYYYYNYVYSNSKSADYFLYQWLDKTAPLLAAVLILVLILLVVRQLKSFKNAKN